MSEHRPVSRLDIEGLVRIAAPFSVSETIEYLFRGLGLAGRIGEFREAFSIFEGSGRISIARGFFEYEAWCRNQGIALRIITTASEQRLKDLRLLKGHTIHLNGKSKADPHTFMTIRETLDLVSGNTIVIDDCPMVLAAASRAGFSTVLMETPLYPRSVANRYSEWINFRVKSWPGFLRLSKKFFR